MSEYIENLASGTALSSLQEVGVVSLREPEMAGGGVHPAEKPRLSTSQSTRAQPWYFIGQLGRHLSREICGTVQVVVFCRLHSSPVASVHNYQTPEQSIVLHCSSRLQAGVSCRRRSGVDNLICAHCYNVLNCWVSKSKALICRPCSRIASTTTDPQIEEGIWETLEACWTRLHAAPAKVATGREKW